MIFSVNRYFVVTRDSPIFHVFLPISVSLSFSVSVRASCLPVYPTGFHSFPTSVIASRSSFIIMFCAKKIYFSVSPCQSVHRFNCPCVCPLVSPSGCVSVCPFVCLSVCPSVCLYVGQSQQPWMMVHFAPSHNYSCSKF